MNAAWLAEHDVARVHAGFVDLHGRLRTKALPADDPAVERGVRFCAMALAEDARGAPQDALSDAAERYRDMTVALDRATLALRPGSPATAWLIGSAADPRCPRAALQRAVAALAASGAELRVGPELELHLLTRAPVGRPRPAGPAHEVAYRDDGAPGAVLEALYAAAASAGLRPGRGARECGRGQVELTLAPSAPLAAADRTVLLRETARIVAARHGLEACFLALPFDAAQPSGLHLHLSLAACAAPGPDASRAVLGGLLAHAGALTALASPTVNGYRRLAAGGLVPARADWGPDDRFAWVRALGDRVELRAADPLACPHLLLAGVLLAAADGLRRGLDPGPPRGAGAAAPPLPAALDDALDALAADAEIAHGLGGELVATFVAVKREEARRARRHVTPWEWDEYAALR